jgi:hypothetical protein
MWLREVLQTDDDVSEIGVLSIHWVEDAGNTSEYLASINQATWYHLLRFIHKDRGHKILRYLGVCKNI